MLEGLRRTPPKVRSNLMDIRCIVAARGRFKRAFLKHTKPRQSMNSSLGNMELSTFIPVGTPDAPSTGSTVIKKEGLDSHLHPLNTLKHDLKLENVLPQKSIPKADDLHGPLQQLCWVTRCVKISYRSLQRWMHSYVKP